MSHMTCVSGSGGLYDLCLQSHHLLQPCLPGKFLHMNCERMLATNDGKATSIPMAAMLLKNAVSHQVHAAKRY